MHSLYGVLFILAKRKNRFRRDLGPVLLDFEDIVENKTGIAVPSHRATRTVVQRQTLFSMERSRLDSVQALTCKCYLVDRSRVWWNLWTNLNGGDVPPSRTFMGDGRANLSFS